MMSTRETLKRCDECQEPLDPDEYTVDGVCSACIEHHENEDAMRDEEQRQAYEHESEIIDDDGDLDLNETNDWEYTP